MQWNDPNDIRIQAAQNFVENVLYQQGDEVAIYRFTSNLGNNPRNLEAFHGSGANYESYPFNNTINKYLNDTPGFGNNPGGVWYFQSNGGTPFYQCMQTALNQMSAWSKQDQYPVLIALTDGISNAGTTFRNFLPMARAGSGTGGVPVYTIGLSASVYVEQLYMIAEISNGGKYYYAPTADSLNDTFAHISADISNSMSRSVSNADKTSINDDVVPDYGTGSRDMDSRAVQNLQILNPAGGESWGQGVFRNITWACRATTQSNCGQATIYFDNGSGSGWQQIASPVGTDLFFPDSDGDAIPEKWNFYSAVTTYWYPSNPAGGLINWDDGGVNSQSRPKCVAANSCVFVYNYNWTVPEVVTNNAKIRISVTDAGSTVNSDSGAFQIFKMNITKGIIIKMLPAKDNLWAPEDGLYQVHYWAKGGTDLNWTFDSNATWLKWNTTSHNLTGNPINSDVGKYWVKINVSLGTLYSDEHNFTITVNNTPPALMTYDSISALQDRQYLVDYNSSDDGQGCITWHLKTKVGAWLSINSTTGILSGTPGNDDIGYNYVNVSVDDGNGGWNWTNFTLNVVNANDPPRIVGQNITEVYQDAEYILNYSVVDIDKADNVFIWSLQTNAPWLNMNTPTGRVSGIPHNSDVGNYWVNVTVKDIARALDFRNFTLTVINVNDPPVWTDVPKNMTIEDTDTYTFDVNATDIDIGDVLKYCITSTPTTSISMDPLTGVIVWKPSSAGKYLLNISATDNNVTIYHDFGLTVLHIVINTPPETTLVTPGHGFILSSLNPTLKWTSTDKEGDNVTFDVYLSNDISLVQNLDVLSNIASKFTDTSFTTPNMLEKGAIYYWTVIPHDGITYGICTSGVWSFLMSANASVNRVPKFVTTPSLEAGVGVEWTYAPTAVDEDPQDTVNISIVSCPDGMSFAAGVLRWTPAANQVGKQSVKIEASDGKTSVFQLFTIIVTMDAPSNHAPVIAHVNPLTIKAGQKISIKLNATDQDGDTLTYSIVGVIPLNSEINDVGQFTWRTKRGDEGVYDIIIKVSDGKLSTTQLIRITVEKADKKVVKGGLDLRLIMILIVIIIATIIAVVLLMRRKSRQKDLEDGATDQSYEAPATQTVVPPSIPVESAPIQVNKPRPKKKMHLEDRPSPSKPVNEEQEAPNEKPTKEPAKEEKPDIEIKTTTIDLDDLED